MRFLSFLWLLMMSQILIRQSNLNTLSLISSNCQSHMVLYIATIKYWPILYPKSWAILYILSLIIWNRISFLFVFTLYCVRLTWKLASSSFISLFYLSIITMSDEGINDNVLLFNLHDFYLLFFIIISNLGLCLTSFSCLFLIIYSFFLCLCTICIDIASLMAVMKSNESYSLSKMKSYDLICVITEMYRHWSYLLFISSSFLYCNFIYCLNVAEWGP